MTKAFKDLSIHPKTIYDIKKDESKSILRPVSNIEEDECLSFVLINFVHISV